MREISESGWFSPQKAIVADNVSMTSVMKEVHMGRLAERSEMYEMLKYVVSHIDVYYIKFSNVSLFIQCLENGVCLHNSPCSHNGQLFMQ